MIKYQDITDAYLKSIQNGECMEDYAPAQVYIYFFIRESIRKSGRDMIELRRDDIQQVLDYGKHTITRAVKALENKGMIVVTRRWLRNEYRLPE